MKTLTALVLGAAALFLLSRKSQTASVPTISTPTTSTSVAAPVYAEYVGSTANVSSVVLTPVAALDFGGSASALKAAWMAAQPTAALAATPADPMSLWAYGQTQWDVGSWMAEIQKLWGIGLPGHAGYGPVASGIMQAPMAGL